MKRLGIILWLLLLIIIIFGHDSFAVEDTDYMSQYDYWFNVWSNEFNIPDGLLKAVAIHESGLDPDNIGCSGDLGLMQLNPTFMKGDFAELDRDYKGYYTNGIDFDWRISRQNIMLGAYKLMRNYNEYGNWDEALSAYNQGTGNHKEYGTRWEYVNKIDWRE